MFESTLTFSAMYTMNARLLRRVTAKVLQIDALIQLFPGCSTDWSDGNLLCNQPSTGAVYPEERPEREEDHVGQATLRRGAHPLFTTAGKISLLGNHGNFGCQLLLAVTVESDHFIEMKCSDSI